MVHFILEIWGTCTNSDRYGCVREGQYGLLPPIMSGKVKSKKTITYGRVDVRAKIPKGDWIWPGKVRIFLQEISFKKITVEDEYFMGDIF